MADYKTASRTKDAFQDELLRGHPEIVLLSPRPVRDDNGEMTAKAYIAVGINPKRRTQSTAKEIPTELPGVDVDGKRDPRNMVPVVTEDVGEIRPGVYITSLRPCPGGFSVGHTSVKGGTLGGVVKAGGNWGYVLSNNHVLANANDADVDDLVLQPGPFDGGTMIGTLKRWVPINFGNEDNEVDCAIAEAAAPWTDNVERHVHTIGVPSGIAAGFPGQKVRKAGRTSETTYGFVHSDNAMTCWLDYRPGAAGYTAKFDHQLELDMTPTMQGGDSGALVFDRDSLVVVGLLFAYCTKEGKHYCYANQIARVLDELGKARTVNTLSGVASLSATTVELV